MAKFTEFTEELEAALAKPTPKSQLQTKKQGGATISFTSDQYVIDRLNEEVGVGGWQDDYAVTTYSRPVEKRGATVIGSVVCHLKVLGVMKSAAADLEFQEKMYGTPATNAQAKAFKRAAMKFGIARELWNKDAAEAGEDDEEEEEAPRRPSRPTTKGGGKTVKLSDPQAQVLLDKGFTRKDVARVGSYDIVGGAIALSKKRKMGKGDEFSRDDIESLLKQYSGGSSKHDDYEDEDEDMDDED